MITFFQGYEARFCSAFGLHDDGNTCPCTPTRLVLIDDLWLGGAACEDERHAAMVVSWTLAHVDRYGCGGAVSLAALQAAVARRTRTSTR